LQLSLELDYEISAPGCDFIFNIHVAHTERQRVVDEALTLSQDVVPNVETDPATRNRYMRVRAFAGPLRSRTAPPSTFRTTSYSPTRSPRFPWRACPRRCSATSIRAATVNRIGCTGLAMREFGQQWQGYSRVQGIRDWVLQRAAPRHSRLTARRVDAQLFGLNASVLACASVHNRPGPHVWSFVR
jgi:hypothetical protein